VHDASLRRVEAYTSRFSTRRELLKALGACTLIASAPSFAQQQQGKPLRIGLLFLLSRQSAMETGRYTAFLDGMRELGYVEGKNLIIERRYADGYPDRLPRLASELVNLNVEVLVTAGTVATGAAQKATLTIPIVMANASDPVGSGFVKSLAHPGGNITGLSSLTADASPKYLELLLSVAPRLSRVALMQNPGNSSHAVTRKRLEAAAQRTRITIVPVEAQTAQEIEQAFPIIVKEKAGAIIVASDSFFAQQRRQLAQLATKNRLPSISARREYVEAGFLLSYGQSSGHNFHRAAAYVDKIFKGARPAELPVEQPTHFELFVNGTTAKTLGIKIPNELLVRADKVIE
jgi:putative ABC transport system substrate-binding protein